VKVPGVVKIVRVTRDIRVVTLISLLRMEGVIKCRRDHRLIGRVIRKSLHRDIMKIIITK
jgi:hypothetical protein